MSEENLEKKEPVSKEFLVFLKVEPAIPNAVSPEILDRVTATNEEEVKDYVVGWLAERDYVATQWYWVAELEPLARLAGVVGK